VAEFEGENFTAWPCTPPHSVAPQFHSVMEVAGVASHCARWNMTVSAWLAEAVRCGSCSSDVASIRMQWCVAGLPAGDVCITAGAAWDVSLEGSFSRFDTVLECATRCWTCASCTMLLPMTHHRTFMRLMRQQIRPGGQPAYHVGACKLVALLIPGVTAQPTGRCHQCCCQRCMLQSDCVKC
jgi:hypothetical protein